MPDSYDILLPRFAHDLRACLRTILMQTQRLQRSADGVPDSAAKIDAILQAARKQDALIAAVMDFVQASEPGVKPVAWMPCKLALQTAVMKVQPRRTQSGATIETAVEPDTADWLVPSDLAKAIEKALDNALLYAETEAIPNVRITASNAGPDCISIDVDDAGIGIPAEYAEQVFEPFFRLHTHDKYPGFGMGLSICRRLMNRAGGSVSIGENPSGAGVRCRLTTPATLKR